MEKEKLKPEQALAEALDFTEEDLAANRAGVLSEAQRRYFMRLRNHKLREQIAYITFVVGLGSLVTVQAEFIFIFCSYGGIALLFWMVNHLPFVKYHRTLTQNRVAGVTGRIQLRIMNRIGDLQYQLKIGQQAFHPNKQRFLIFKNGDPYTIYYAPYTNRILSAE